MKQTARWLFYNYQLEKGISPLLAIAHFPVLTNRFKFWHFADRASQRNLRN